MILARRATLLALTGAAFLVLVGCAARGATAGARSPYVPATESKRIVAYFGKTYLPGWLPHGYVYARWETIAGSADAFGEYLSVSFGDRGRLLRWTVDVPQDPQEYSHNDCAKRPLGHVLTVNGKRIVYSEGAVGQTATLCVSRTTAVTVWNRYSVSKVTLARIAASAVSAG